MWYKTRDEQYAHQTTHRMARPIGHRFVDCLFSTLPRDPRVANPSAYDAARLAERGIVPRYPAHRHFAHLGDRLRSGLPPASAMGDLALGFHWTWVTNIARGYASRQLVTHDRASRHSSSWMPSRHRPLHEFQPVPTPRLRSLSTPTPQ